jgi:hypothetical protein
MNLNVRIVLMAVQRKTISDCLSVVLNELSKMRRGIAFGIWDYNYKPGLRL